MKSKSNVVAKTISSNTLGCGPIGLKTLNCAFDEITVYYNESNPSSTEIQILSNYLYCLCRNNKTLVVLSHVSIRSTLLLKTFRFDLPSVSQDECRVEVVVFDKYVYFIGLVDLCNRTLFEAAIDYLYSGIIDTGNFILVSSGLIDNADAIKKATMVEFDRHNIIRGVRVKVDKIIERDELSVLYPYGGVDFGCMIMYVVS